MIDTAALRKLLSEATPGPWRVSMSGYSVKSDDPDVPIVATVHGGASATKKQVTAWLANSDAIVAAVNALPALLDRIDRCEGALREITEHSEDCSDSECIGSIARAALKGEE